MGSTFSGLEIGKRGLMVHQQALKVTGHNIANASNEHYARQRVEITAMNPLYDPAMNRALTAGTIGQGSKISAITRVRDNFLDGRIHQAEQGKTYWSFRQKYLHHIEVIYNEPAEESLKAQIDNFWASWQELSQYPEELSHRELVRTSGQELTFRLRSTFDKLIELREQIDFEIQANVNQLNTLAYEIRDINEKILKHQTLGDNPNDLLDRRDKLLQELSALADISVEKSDPDELIVYIGGQMLIQGELQNKLQVVSRPENEGLSAVVWESNQSNVLFKNGKMQSLLELRDQVLRENIDKLDLLAVNVADIVNEVHRDGFGLTKETNIDFFEMKTLSRNIRGNFDFNGDGQDDISTVFKMAGRNAVESNKPVGVSGTLTFVKNDENETPVNITYRPDDTLDSIIDRINKSGAGVVAYMNHQDNLALKAVTADDDWRKNFMIRHVEDSGELLVGYAGILQNSGAAGAFDYQRIDEINKLQSNLDRITLTPTLHGAGALEISDLVKGNAALIAAAGGKDIGGTGNVNESYGLKDGSNALKIAQALRHEKRMIGNHETTDDFYNALISKIGIQTREAGNHEENQKIIMTNLENMRQSVMGVNLDEEMANMVQFQHAYNASAKIIQVMNEMLDRIINRLF
ncbi:MAG: flagellar hook-associated protein FlgK [Spirochaetia bacterium]|nr:flagellar hook-associated protein FlgK [Spirochaetia bacterium]